MPEFFEYFRTTIPNRIMKQLGRKYGLIMLCSLSLLHTELFGLDETGFGYEYVFSFWNSSSGLPQNSVNDITQDSTGFIWFTTYDGIVRFDGNSFKIYNTQNTEELPTNRWTGLVHAKGDEIYFFSYEGYLLHKKGDNFITYNIQPSSYFSGICSYDDVKGLLFAEGSSILQLYDDEIRELYQVPDTIPGKRRITSLAYIADRETVYFSLEKQANVYSYDLKNQKTSKISAPVEEVKNLFFENGLMVALGKYKMTFFDNEVVYKTIEFPAETEGLNSYAVLEGNKVLIPLVESLFKLDLNTYESQIIKLPKEDYRYSLQSLFVDKDGAIWGGTNIMGLFMARTSVFKSYSNLNHSGGPEVNPVLFNREGKIFAGLNCNGAAIIDTSGVAEVRHSAGVSTLRGSDDEKKIELCIYSIYEDYGGGMWYGTSNNGVIYESKSGDIEFFKEELVSYDVRAIKGFGKYIFIGHMSGISIYSIDNVRFIPVDSLYENTQLIADEAINYFYGLSTGDIIVGTHRSGAYVLGSDQKVKPFKNSAQVKTPNVRAVHEDSLGNIWLGTYGSGLLFCEKGVDTVLEINTTDGLFDNVVSALVQKDDYLYMTCNKGLYRVSLDNFYDFINGDIDRIYSEYFGEAANTELIEFNGGFQQTFAKTDRGTILFPSYSGVMEFLPDRIRPVSECDVFFDQVLVDGETLKDFREGFHLKSDIYSLVFHLSAPSYLFPENLVIEYRLKNLTDGWQSTRGDNIIEFTGLPHGEYTLETRIKHLSNGVGGFRHSEIDFKVNAPFYLRAEAIILFSILVVLASFIWSYINRRKNLKNAVRIKNLLNDRTQKLREIKANLEAVINNTDELIWCVDTDFKLLVANDAYLNLHRNKFNSELEKGDFIFKDSDPSAIDFWFPHFEKTLSGEKSTLIVNSKSSKGKKIVNEVSFYPIWKDEEITGLVGFTKDVTKIKKREEELKNASKMAKEAARLKSEFLATMSHEIRTPINAVIGMTSLLQETSLTNEQEAHVDNIRFGGETLLNIINDILDFSKGEAKKITPENYNFNVRSSISNTLSLIDEKASQKKVELIKKVSDDVPDYVYADESKLRQVLLNLLSNATKFTEKGSIKLECNWENNIKSDGGKLIFRVSDTGIGIPPDKLKNLFSPFFQVDGGASRKYGGTGLGLAISKNIVKSLGGNISVKSKPGEGSVFEFYITCQKSVVNLGDDSIRPENIDIELSFQDSKLQSDVEDTLKNVGLYDAVKYRRTGALVKFLITDNLPSISGVHTILLLKKKDDTKPREGEVSIVNERFQSEKLPEAISSVYFEYMRNYESNKEDNLDLSNLRILVAEDNVVNQKLVRMVLKKLGLTCDIVSNGLEVLKSLETNKYNFIYMDCQMPEMDGYEASRAIREKESEIGSPIIVAMTANAMPEDREKCFAAGMDDYLAKPIDLNTIKSNVIKWSTIMRNKNNDNGFEIRRK